MKRLPDASRVALLGTSADPPTYGHQALLEGLLTLFPQVITWASNNPIKQHGATLTIRKKMLSALVRAISNPHLQLVQELSSPRTITTLKRAKDLWPTKDLIFIIGSDLTREVPNWVQAKDIMQKANIGIAPREGWPVTSVDIEMLQSLGGEVEILPLKIPATASSKVRNQTVTSDIPKVILPILLKENLYGLSANKKCG